MNPHSHASKLSQPARLSGLHAALLLSSLLASGWAGAQVAGTTTTGVAVVESTQAAMGWSAKKSILGKTVYNDSGDKVGKVEDLIVSPDKNVSYLIIGAGGFIGIGRHDVAISINQVKSQSGKLVMSGATKESIKAMPAFDYTNDTADRDALLNKAAMDISKGKAKLAEWQAAAGKASADVKAKMDSQIATLQIDLSNAETKLSAMKQAGAKRWKEFESDLGAALLRLRKSTDPTV